MVRGMVVVMARGTRYEVSWGKDRGRREGDGASESGDVADGGG